MKELLVKFLNEYVNPKYKLINNKIYIYGHISYFHLDENNNLLDGGKISCRNDEWILFCRKEKLKILNKLENERIIG